MTKAMTQPDNVTRMTNTDPLTQLRKDTASATRLADRRDDLIVQAREGGATWRAISEAVGMTELATRNAAARANDGQLPTPKAVERSTT